MTVTVRAGVLWCKGKMLNQGEANRIAAANGYVYSHQLAWAKEGLILVLSKSLRIKKVRKSGVK